MQKIKSFIGKVVSNKMTKVVVVEVERRKVHPLYKKSLKRTKKYHVQTDTQLGLGQTVRFVETSPISKTVFWKVVEVIGEKIEKEATKEKTAKSKATK